MLTAPMPSARPCAAALLLLFAAGRAGAGGIVSEGDRTTLPISESGGMPVMETSSTLRPMEDDAGLLWAPASLEVPIQQLGAPIAPVDGGSGDGGLHAPPVPAHCAAWPPLIAHRTAFLRELEDKSARLGRDAAHTVLCGPGAPPEVECSRPPTVAEEDIREATTDDPTQPGREADAWLVRWRRALRECIDPVASVEVGPLGRRAAPLSPTDVGARDGGLATPDAGSGWRLPTLPTVKLTPKRPTAPRTR